ncbi:MAG: RNA polymerase sigma factor [Gaiellaceae bacterium]
MASRAPAAAERDLERLYRLHRRDVYRSVLRSVRNPDEAEDVTQIAFLDAYRALQRGDEPERPRAWLLTIAQNVARRRHARIAGRPREVELAAETLVAPDEQGPTAREIRLAFEHLGARQREALILREIGGRSYREIAAALDLSVPAVETLLFRARQSFRHALPGRERTSATRRTFGGLLLWPLPDGARETAAAAGGWLAGRSAAAKLAGGLAAAALGTGLVVSQAPVLAPAAGERPAARAKPVDAPALRAAAAHGSRPASKPKAAAADARRPARERRARRSAAPQPEVAVELPAVEEATAPVLGLVEAATGSAQKAAAPLTEAVDEVPAPLPELELPPLDTVPPLP